MSIVTCTATDAAASSSLESLTFAAGIAARRGFRVDAAQRFAIGALRTARHWRIAEVSFRKTATIHTSDKGNRVLTLRGSEYGMCFHRHIACLRGLEEAAPSESLKKIFAGGNDSEVYQKRKLTEWGARLIEDASGWENQISLRLWDFHEAENRAVVMKASPDGLIEIVDNGFNAPGCKLLRDNGLEIEAFAPPKPRRFALENKFLGEASFHKALLHGPRYSKAYAWQVSAVTHGYRDKYKDPSIGVAFMCQLRGKAGQEDQFVLWLLDEPPYTKQEVLQRCWDIFDAVDAGTWMKCDAEYQCRFPHNPPPTPGSVEEAMVQRLIDAQSEHAAALRDVESLLCGVSGDAVVGGRSVRRVIVNSLEVV
jgi:hypothetical protein